MQLDDATCWERLRRSRNGVLSTVHPERGVDAVPVVFVVREEQLVLPIDTVKAKSGARLQRLRNIEVDPRVVLLVDRYDDDWSGLWWVRVHGRAHEAVPTRAHRDALATSFPAYRHDDAVAAVVVVEVEVVAGWQAEDR